MFPFRGFHTFSDSISHQCWNINKQQVLSGDGAIAISSAPAGDRAGALECSSSEGAGTAYVFQRLINMPFGADINPSEEILSSPATHLRVRLQVSGLPSSGAVEIAALGATSDRLQVFLRPTGEVDVYIDAALVQATTEAIASGQWFELGLSRTASGTAVVQFRRDGESSWSQLYSGATGSAEIQSIEFGVIQCLGSSSTELSVYVDDFAVSDVSFGDTDGHWYLAGSGIRDTGKTEAIAVLVYPDNLIRNATQAKVLYGASDDIAQASQGDFADLSGAVHHALPLALFGLSPGVKLNYWFQVADAGGNLLWTSSRRTFWTLPGNVRSISFSTQSCMINNAAAHPYSDLSFVADHAEVAANWLGVINTGDYGYADNNSYGQIEPDTFPSETTDDFERTLRETSYDHELERLMRAGMFMALVDDHSTFNDGDARHAPGGALATQLANDSTQIGQGAYPTNPELQVLWQRGYEVFDAWFTGHLLNPGIPGARYSSKSFGQTRWLFLDVRHERRPDLNEFISSQQYSWLAGEITAFGQDSVQQVLHIFSQGSFSTLAAKSTEGWERIAEVQWKSLMQHIYDNVPVTKRVVLHSGDDHVGWAINNRFWKDGAYSSDLPLTHEAKSSGISNGLYPIPSADISSLNSYYVAPAEVAGFDAIQFSGLLFEETQSSATASGWADSSQALSDFSIFALPGGGAVNGWQRKITLTCSASSLSGSAALTGLSLLIARDSFLEGDANDTARDAIFSPTSGDAAQANGEDLRARLVGEEAFLESDLVTFVRDSSDGARDGQLEWYVGVPSVDPTQDLTIEVLWRTAEATTKQDGTLAYPNAVAVFHGDSLLNSATGQTATLLDAASVTSIDGKVGKAYDFDGSYLVRTASGIGIEGNDDRTDMVWIKTVTRGVVFLGYGGLDGGTNGERWTFRVGNSTPTLRTEIQGTGKSTTPEVSDGQYHFLARTFTGSNLSGANHYVDGSLSPESATNTPGSTAVATGTIPLSIGGHMQNNASNRHTSSSFIGEVDEVRVYSIVQAPEWLASTYANQNAPGTFWSAGIPEVLGLVQVSIKRTQSRKVSAYNAYSLPGGL